jgi:hypothetical protein
VAAFGGDCTLPLAAWGRFVGGGFTLTALLAMPDGGELVRSEAVGSDARSVAGTCVEQMRAQGADALLERLHGTAR